MPTHPARAPLVRSRWLMSLLDAQTSWYREMERCMVSLIQPWLDTRPSPAAQPLVDAMLGLRLLGPAALQRACTDWAEVWAAALRHDAGEH